MRQKDTMPIVYKASGAGTDLVDAGDIDARQPLRKG